MFAGLNDLWYYDRANERNSKYLFARVYRLWYFAFYLGMDDGRNFRGVFSMHLSHPWVGLAAHSTNHL